ncbi:MAG: hydroxymethylbilane synthase [Methyloligellaceae bacterium]
MSFRVSSGDKSLQSLKINIGTRGSPLALWQANTVRELLMSSHGLSEDQVAIHIIKTSGDKIQDKALRAFGGKGLFTKEIEEALQDKRIDIAVHSMKDMPTQLPDGLEISCYLKREDVRDAFLSPKAKTLLELPQGAVLGSSSLRRQAQVKRLRPDIQVVTYRGNVETRLRKLEEGEVDATLLACAGLKRLGMEGVITSCVEIDDMMPAIAQGAIGIEQRSGDDLIRELLTPLNHKPTEVCVKTERAFLRALDGSCQTPIAGLAELNEDQIVFVGEILKPDGSIHFEASGEAAIKDGEKLGRELAEQLLQQAGEDFFCSV